MESYRAIQTVLQVSGLLRWIRKRFFVPIAAEARFWWNENLRSFNTFIVYIVDNS